MIEIDIEKRFARRGSDAAADAGSARDATAAPRAVTGIAAQIRSDARVLALFGRSGSGKSTVINVIAGLLPADRGRIVVDGETWFDSERGTQLPVERRGVGYVFQDGLLFPHLDVERNLRYGAKSRSATQWAKAGVPFEQVIELLGLAPLLRRATPSLSGGEKQRVAIGRALLAQPRLSRTMSVATGWLACRRTYRTIRASN